MATLITWCAYHKRSPIQKWRKERGTKVGFGKTMMQGALYVYGCCSWSRQNAVKPVSSVNLKKFLGLAMRNQYSLAIN